jgi:hypothetical protein
MVELETLLTERCLDTATRLLCVLRRLGLQYGRATALGHVLELPLDQTELAALVGTTRETVNRALRTLSAHGVVTLWEGRPLLIRMDRPAQGHARNLLRHPAIDRSSGTPEMGMR